MNRIKSALIQTWGVYQQGIYLANPLVIVLRSQLDTPTEAIVMKVTSRKSNEKGFIAESSGCRPALHSATVALCSGWWLTPFTWYNATWPLELPVGPYEWGDLEPGHRYFVKKFHSSWMAAYWEATLIQEGQVQVWRSLYLHGKVSFLWEITEKCSCHTALNYL